MGHINAQVVGAQGPKYSPGLGIWLSPPQESDLKLQASTPRGKDME